MFKFDSNLLMVFLLFLFGIYFILGLILKISISETTFLMGLILFFSIIVVIHGYKTLGPRELVIFFLIAYSITLLYEYTDGLGFCELINCKSYYTDLLGPKFLGKTPYVIPLVWSISLYCTYTMTNIIFKRLKTNHKSEEKISYKWFSKIFAMGIVTGLMMASWDLINDPVMVKIGAWSWSYHGSYYGIPLWNYEAWVEIPFVIFVIFNLYLYKIKKSQIYINGEKKSNFTLLVVILYISLLLVYSFYAINENVTDVIPWAAIAMVTFTLITIFQFYKLKIS